MLLNTFKIDLSIIELIQSTQIKSPQKVIVSVKIFFIFGGEI